MSRQLSVEHGIVLKDGKNDVSLVSRESEISGKKFVRE